MKNVELKHDSTKNGKEQLSISVVLLFFLLKIHSRQRYKDLRGKSLKKSRTWILEKKERWRNKGRSDMMKNLHVSLEKSMVF